MTNEEFQKAVLQELKAINSRFDGIDQRFDGIDQRFDGLDQRIGGLENTIEELKEGQRKLEARQNEIYQVVRAIEHSNQVGKSELDSQNIRLAKVEGKLKRVAMAYNEDLDIDKASNL